MPYLGAQTNPASAGQLHEVVSCLSGTPQSSRGDFVSTELGTGLLIVMKPPCYVLPFVGTCWCVLQARVGVFVHVLVRSPKCDKLLFCCSPF